jgi:hypothetical protein
MSQSVTRKSLNEFKELFTCIVFFGVKDRNGAFFLYVPSEDVFLCAIPQHKDGLEYLIYESRLGLMSPIQSTNHAKDLVDLLWSSEDV